MVFFFVSQGVKNLNYMYIDGVRGMVVVGRGGGGRQEVIDAQMGLRFEIPIYSLWMVSLKRWET